MSRSTERSGPVIAVEIEPVEAVPARSTSLSPCRRDVADHVAISASSSSTTGLRGAPGAPGLGGRLRAGENRTGAGRRGDTVPAFAVVRAVVTGRSYRTTASRGRLRCGRSALPAGRGPHRGGREPGWVAVRCAVEASGRKALRPPAGQVDAHVPDPRRAGHGHSP